MLIEHPEAGLHQDATLHRPRGHSFAVLELVDPGFYRRCGEPACSEEKGTREKGARIIV